MAHSIAQNIVIDYVLENQTGAGLGLASKTTYQNYWSFPVKRLIFLRKIGLFE